MSVERSYQLKDGGGVAEADRLREQARLAIQQELPLLLGALRPGERLLDLGCGSGLLGSAVAEARPDCQVLGIDPDPLALEEARRLYRGANLAFAAGGVEDGPKDEGQKGDVVVLRLVLMHLPDVEASLKSLEAWLRPGGRLHIIEGDDRALRLEPWSDGLQAILDLMERVQAARGGSRRRGMDLAKHLDRGAWRLLGQSQAAPPAEAAAQAVGKVFAPVATFYLRWALEKGLVQPEEYRRLSLTLQQACETGFHRAYFPLFHAWAQRREDLVP